MSYAEDLAKLKLATARSKDSLRRKLPDYACCVCNARPAPMTRFGPRCEAHAPTEPVDNDFDPNFDLGFGPLPEEGR